MSEGDFLRVIGCGCTCGCWEAVRGWVGTRCAEIVCVQI